jgi:hypothetical protein
VPDLTKARQIFFFLHNQCITLLYLPVAMPKRSVGTPLSVRKKAHCPKKRTHFHEFWIYANFSNDWLLISPQSCLWIAVTQKDDNYMYSFDIHLGTDQMNIFDEMTFAVCLTAVIYCIMYAFSDQMKDMRKD